MAGLLANPETAGATISGAVDMVGELIDSLELQEEVKAPLAEIFGVFSRGVKNSGLNRKDRRPWEQRNLAMNYICDIRL